MDEANETSEGGRRGSRVAVLMAAYDAERTLRQAVDSILAQTMPADLLIVDDCSRRPVAEVLADLADRVTIHRMPANGGPSAARNAGLALLLAQGYDFVAVMDADDVAYPDRLAEQVAFLDAHPRVGAVGGWIHMREEASFAPVYVQGYPADDAAIRKAMFFNSAMAHPTVTFRASVLAEVGAYDVRTRTAEDFDLLRRVQQRAELANLPHVVLDYRLSLHGQSMGNRRRQLRDRLRVQLRYFDPRTWRAWAGVGWTLLLFLVPLRVKMALSVLLGSKADGRAACASGAGVRPS